MIDLFSSVLISEDTWRQLAGRFAAERVDSAAWRLNVPPSPLNSDELQKQSKAAVTNSASANANAAHPSAALQSLLFPAAPRRFSMMTIPQAINFILPIIDLCSIQIPILHLGRFPSAQSVRQSIPSSSTVLLISCCPFRFRHPSNPLLQAENNNEGQRRRMATRRSKGPFRFLFLLPSLFLPFLLHLRPAFLSACALFPLLLRSAR